MQNDFLARAAHEGVGPQEILATILDPEWNAKLFRDTREGQQLRELGAGAQMAVAMFHQLAEGALLKIHEPDPPDITLWLPGFNLPGLCFDIVDVVRPGSRPNAEDIDLERRTQIVIDARTEADKLNAIETHLMGKASVRWLSQVVADNEREFLLFRSQAKTELLKKARKYNARAERDEEFRERPPFGLILSAGFAPAVGDWGSPERWAGWVSPDEMDIAKRFPEIVLTTTDVVRHQALALRVNGDWLESPCFWQYRNVSL